MLVAEKKYSATTTESGRGCKERLPFLWPCLIIRTGIVTQVVNCHEAAAMAEDGLVNASTNLLRIRASVKLHQDEGYNILPNGHDEACDPLRRLLTQFDETIDKACGLLLTAFK